MNRAVTRGLVVLTGVGLAALAVGGCSTVGSGSGATESLPSQASTAPEFDMGKLSPQPSSIPPATPKEEGNLDPVQPKDQSTRKTSIKKVAEFGNGVTLQVTKTQRVKVNGEGPGEVSGEGVRFTMKITNGSDREIDLNTVTATVAYGSDRKPASPSAVAADVPFNGVLKPGESATGSYVFSVPPAGEKNVEVQVSYSADEPIVVLVGAV